MTTIQRSLILAAAMILVALAAVVGVLPETAAQYSPLAMMVFLPWALRGERSSCGAA
uniref:hypothetical protein n=1 Tax=Parerythrobacter lutipelagi TaxID=1964208 RepID=UPI0013764107|nr:hypothetical protein [Parerythrobacter lutipelagi]